MPRESGSYKCEWYVPKTIVIGSKTNNLSSRHTQKVGLHKNAPVVILIDFNQRQFIIKPGITILNSIILTFS